jgi:Zn-dependent peptidase ImmA (M78 family)
VKSKDVTDIMEQVQAESQATKEQRQETRVVANKLLMTIEELNSMRQPVQEAASHISQIQQDVLVSSDALETTKSGML